jgi:hypothetical protein
MKINDRTTEDPTIGTCWNAYRLDIGRAGITPEASYMSNAAGRGGVGIAEPPILSATKL